LLLAFGSLLADGRAVTIGQPSIVRVITAAATIKIYVFTAFVSADHELSPNSVSGVQRGVPRRVHRAHRAGSRGHASVRAGQLVATRVTRPLAAQASGRTRRPGNASSATQDCPHHDSLTRRHTGWTAAAWAGRESRRPLPDRSAARAVGGWSAVHPAGNGSASWPMCPVASCGRSLCGGWRSRRSSTSPSQPRHQADSWFQITRWPSLLSAHSLF
jgi:hypothetical protein